jgi:hypothetical protein
MAETFLKIRQTNKTQMKTFLGPQLNASIPREYMGDVQGQESWTCTAKKKKWNWDIAQGSVAEHLNSMWGPGFNPNSGKKNNSNTEWIPWGFTWMKAFPIVQLFLDKTMLTHIPNKRKIKQCKCLLVKWFF